jgi:type I restriction enzyme M protein
MTRSDRGGHVEQVVWKACEVFGRSVFPLQDFYPLVASILILKLLADIAEDRENGCSGGGPLLWRQIKLPSGLKWKKLVYSDSNLLDSRLTLAFQELERLNEEVFCDVFGRLGVYRLLEAKGMEGFLLKVVDVMQSLDLRPSRLGSASGLAEAYEKIAIEFMESKHGGGYPVPNAIASLMVEISDPKSGESVYDPFCGCGQLLARSFAYAGSASLIGQAQLGPDWALSKLNMFVNGVSEVRLETADVLRSPVLGPDAELPKFDVVLSNPPFGMGNWGSEAARNDRRFWRGVPPAGAADYAFLSHIVESMRDGGRAMVIVSLGSLFRGGSEAEIRKKFIQENIVDGVVALPPNLFSATRIPVAVVSFRKGRKVRDVLFVDASQEFVSGKGRNYLSKQSVARLADLFRRRESVLGFSRLVSPEEIESNNFNLNVSRYIERSEGQSIDLETIFSELQEMEDELSGVRSEIDRYIERLGPYRPNFRQSGNDLR